jgi:hypothetical protein
MALPGKIIEEIRNGLVSAFPDEEKLLEMLRFDLDIQKSQVPYGSSYESTVFNLVDKFESDGQIIKLIQKAYNRNSGNPNLRILSQKIPQISLLEILYPLEKKNFKLMLEVYYRCCPADDLNDWKPESLKEILDYLKDRQPEEASENLIIKFVDALLKEKDIPRQAVEDLKEWRRKNVKFLSELVRKIRQKLQHKKQPNTPTFILIVLEPSLQQHYDKRYSVKAWFIRDGKNAIFDEHPDYPPPEVYQNLDVQERNRFFWEEIPNLIKHLLSQINLSDSSTQPTIELFLPYELLQESIHTFAIEEDELLVPIGGQYQVVFRSCKRVAKEYKHRNLWVQKWKSSQGCNKFCHDALVLGDCDWKKLLYILDQNSAIGLKLSKLPSEEIFKVINRTGIPVALWLTQESPEKMFQTDFDKFLQCCSVPELPEKIKQKRLEAFSEGENQIGNYLSLLWENPYIVPPEALPYTTP